MHDRAFGDFQFKQVGIQPGSAECPRHRLNESGLAKLYRRHIHRHEHLWQTGFNP